MAFPRKRLCVEPPKQPSDSENYSESESEEEEEDEPMEIIHVDFVSRVPECDDRQGIKNLLQQLFLKQHIDTYDLSDLLIEQKNITGVLKQAPESDDVELDDEDMDVNFGVFSVINLIEKKDKHSIKQIHSYLLDHCREVSSKDQYETFKSILEDSSKPVGLVISERFVNIPAKISVPLYQNLSKDMEKEGYNFAYYIIISKISNFKKPGAGSQEIEIYLNPEEELIAEEAELTFEFQVQAEQDSGLGGKWKDDDDEGIPKRKVLLIPASKWEAVCNKLTAEFETQ